MAQRPTADFNIDPNIVSGTDLANILNRFQDAIDSGNSGASRPAYLDAGGLWVQTGNPMRLFFYDGTGDRELYNTTDGLVGASQWKDKDDDIYYNDGNVGIGTDDITETLDVKGSLAVNQATGVYLKSASRDATNGRLFWNDTVSALRLASNGDLNIRTGGFGDTNTRLTIDDIGNVGIGMAPLRSTAKEQLEVWSSRFDAHTKADPKADKKALTLEITDNAFDVLPTEAELAEWMEGRAAGDALQVAGDGSFSGDVSIRTFVVDNSNIYRTPAGAGGLKFTSTSAILPTDNTGTNSDGQLSLGGSSQKFKDGYFSGTVTANQFVDVNGPIVSAFTMVEAFRKIKSAVADETTVEGIKESLTNVLGGLIEEFESIGTQES